MWKAQSENFKEDIFLLEAINCMVYVLISCYRVLTSTFTCHGSYKQCWCWDERGRDPRFSFWQLLQIFRSGSWNFFGTFNILMYKSFTLPLPFVWNIQENILERGGCKGKYNAFCFFFLWGGWGEGAENQIVVCNCLYWY